MKQCEDPTVEQACPIYLDYNATVPVYPEVIEAVKNHLGHCGNPSSLHQRGAFARLSVEKARDDVLAAFGGEDLLQCPTGGQFRAFFTSGGTEANALAARLQNEEGPPDYVLFSAVEHPSVMRTFQRAFPQKSHEISVNHYGQVDLHHLETLLQKHQGRCLTSVMAANNETGVLQPLEDVVTLVHHYKGMVHCDASQVPGRLSLEKLPRMLDSITLSGHKMGAPQGVGVLLVKEHITIDPLWLGGGQEGFQRPGTENVSGIIAMGVALDKCTKTQEHMSRISDWRDRMEKALITMFPEICIFGKQAERLGNTSCFAIPKIPWEGSVIAMDLEGIAISAGSACSSGRMLPSHVLIAMGVEDALARCTVRISLGWQTTWLDVETFLKAFAVHVRRVQKLTHNKNVPQMRMAS